MILAHQTLYQIQGSSVESAVLGNTYARMVFRVSDGDAAKLASGFSFFEARDLLALERGQAIMRLGSAERDCNLETLPPTHVDQDVAVARMDAVKTSSRAQFGGSYEVSSRPPIAETITEPTVVATEPVDDGTETPKASDYLPVIHPHGRYEQKSDSQHRYLKHLVARLGQERGFLAVMEEVVSGGRVDVALRRDGVTVACEISVSTEVTHELGNARKCLGGGFQHVMLIAEDDGKRLRLKNAIANDSDLKGVEVCSPEELAQFLDSLIQPTQPDERIVRGYKVRVKRQNQSASDMATRRDTVGKIVTRSIKPEE